MVDDIGLAAADRLVKFHHSVGNRSRYTFIFPHATGSSSLSERCLERTHDPWATVDVRLTGAVIFIGIPVANIEGQCRLVPDAQPQTDVPIGVVDAAIIRVAPLLTDHATDGRREFSKPC